MKIIDEKGRLFKLVNVIDFVFILVCIGILFVFYSGYSIFKKSKIVPKREYSQVELSCRLIRISPNLAKDIHVGDKELDNNGKTIGEIINLGEVGPMVYEYNIGPSKNLVRDDPSLRQILCRLRLGIDVRDNNIYYKGEQILVNSPAVFKTAKYSVTFIPQEEAVEKELILPVLLRELDEKTLKQISVGDKVLDYNSMPIGEIINIGKIEDYSLDASLEEGRFVKAIDMTKKQVSVEMKLLCQIIGDKLRFQGRELGINKPFEIRTSKYSLPAVVSTSSVPAIQWVAVKAKFSSVIPEVVNILQPLDTELDAMGKEPIAKIRNIISIKPSEQVVITEDKSVAVTNPSYKDVILDLNVLCYERGGVYYFQDFPLKIGNSINFTTKLYSITGTITGLNM